jgi:hypothetical protein
MDLLYNHKDSKTNYEFYITFLTTKIAEQFSGWVEVKKLNEP